MMKSFACFVTGIAMIAVVVPVGPVKYVLAQSTTVKYHRCEIAPANPTQYPPTVFCDTAYGHCNTTQKSYFYDCGECVYDVECPSCYLWSSYKSQHYPVDEVDNGLWSVRLGLALGAGVLCFIGGAAVTTLVGGLVAAVVCAGVTHAIDPINACDFLSCKVKPTSIPGPKCFLCN